MHTTDPPHTKQQQQQKQQQKNKDYLHVFAIAGRRRHRHRHRICVDMSIVGKYVLIGQININIAPYKAILIINDNQVIESPPLISAVQ